MTDDEIIDVLRKGKVVDLRSCDEVQALGNFSCLPYGRVTLKGRFVEDLLRNQLADYPNGLQIYGASIVGDIIIEAVQFNRIIAFENCYFNGSLVLRHCSFMVLDLKRTSVQGPLDLRGSTFNGLLGLRDGTVSYTACLLRDVVVVNGPVDLTGASFFYNKYGVSDSNEIIRAAERHSISLARLKAKSLFWRQMSAKPNAIVSLRDAEVDVFRDDMQSELDLEQNWPSSGGLRVERFVYRDRSTIDPNILLGWLKLQVGGHAALSAYEILTKCLDRMGEEIAADRITVEKQRLLIKTERRNANRVIRWIYLVMSDSGRNIQKSVIFSIVLYIISSFAVWEEWQEGWFAPRDTGVVSNTCYLSFDAKKCDGWTFDGRVPRPRDYPPFSPFGYTLDAFVPAVNYGFSQAWYPKSPLAMLTVFLIRTIGVVTFSIILLCIAAVTRRGRQA